MKDFPHSYHLGLLRLVASHLEPHVAEKRDGKDRIAEGLLSISERQIYGLVGDPMELNFLTEGVYRGRETVFTFDGDEVKEEVMHVFSKRGIDRLLGAGWQSRETQR